MDFNVNDDYVSINEMAELTWDNGKLLVNGLGLGLGLRDNSSAAVGTLESVVSLATQRPRRNDDDGDDINVPRLDIRSHQPQHVSAASVTDALVPCARAHNDQDVRACDGDGFARANKGRRVGGERSGSGSGHVRRADTCEKGSCGFGGAATASFWSLASTRDTNSVEDDLDESEACLTRSQGNTSNKGEKKGRAASSSLLTKRSRAAEIHNQSERKRRETINEKMKILQKMVPNSSKTDKSSMLDEVIDYLKQLQAQVQLMMIGRMNIPSMMMPYAMPQHSFQMPMMPPMDIAMNMSMAHQNLANLAAPLVNPSTGFMPMVAGADHLSPSLVPVASNNPSPYLAQSQSMSFDTYTRMIAIMQQQQLQQQQQQQQLDATKK